MQFYPHVYIPVMLQSRYKIVLSPPMNLLCYLFVFVCPSPFSPFLTLATTNLFFISLTLRECYIHGIKHHSNVTFCNWLLSLSVMPLRSTLIVAYIVVFIVNIFLLLDSISTVWISLSLFNHPPTEGQSICFQVFASMSESAVNSHVQVFV